MMRFLYYICSCCQVVSFDGSTTVAEFLHSLNRTLAVRDCALSGFCLFTDDPAGQELEHCLKTHLKVSFTLPSKQETLNHCCLNVGTASKTVAQHSNNRGSTFCVCLVSLYILCKPCRSFKPYSS